MSRQTILLIDDDPEDLGALAAALVAAEYEVIAVNDGREALHWLTSKNAEPALIVTDLAMPDMSGWEFINILQAYVRLSLIPLIVVSGVDLKPELLARDAVAEFFTKPISTERFLDGVKRHARRRPRPPGLAVTSSAVGQLYKNAVEE